MVSDKLRLSKVDKPRVLMVCYLFPPNFGGAIVQALRLSRELKRQSVSTSFLTDAGTSRSRDYVYEDNNVYSRKTFSDNEDNKIKQFIWAIRIFLFAILNKNRFDILHFHSVRGPELLIIPALKLLGFRIVYKITLANSDDPYTFSQRNLFGPLYRRVFPYIDRVIALTPKLYDQAVLGGLKEHQISLVTNGVDTSTYKVPSSTERDMVRSDLSIPQDSLVISCVGAIEHRKGYDILIPAYLRMMEKHDNLYLIIVGPGNVNDNDYYADLAKLIPRRLSDHIRFVGKTDNVYQYLAASDVFAFCSREEGFGSVVIEALCTGLGVCVTPIDGIMDFILANYPEAEICNAAQHDEFAEKCARLLRSRQKYDSHAVSQRAAKQFGIAPIAMKYVEIYQSL